MQRQDSELYRFVQPGRETWLVNQACKRVPVRYFWGELLLSGVLATMWWFWLPGTRIAAVPLGLNTAAMTCLYHSFGQLFLSSEAVPSKQGRLARLCWETRQWGTRTVFLVALSVVGIALWLVGFLVWQQSFVPLFLGGAFLMFAGRILEIRQVLCRVLLRREEGMNATIADG